MKKYTYIELSNMSDEELQKVLNTLNDIFKITVCQESGYLNDLKKDINKSKDHKINYIFEKQVETEQILDDIFAELDSEKSLKLLKGGIKNV